MNNKDSATGRGGPSAMRIVATVLLPFGLGYYLSYLYRTMNAVLAPQLVAELGLTASELGFLTAVYFVTFAAIQLPLGVFLDRYGPRRAQAALLVAAAIGGVVFGLGQDMVVLSIGRALIGLGVAGAFMAILKANAVWWPSDRLPLLNGIAASFGSIGALSATSPVELALAFIDWRAMFLIIAAFTLLLAAVTWLVVPERGQPGVEGTGLAAQTREIGGIYTDPYFWRIGIMIIFGFGVFISYQTLWAGPWLRDVAGFDRMAVANRLLLAQLGMFVGTLGGGVLADRLARTGGALSRVIALGCGCFLLVQILLALEITALAGLLWAAFGFFGSSLFLCYSLYAQHYPASLIGRVNTANNLLLFGAVFVLQWGIGGIIGLWPERPDGSYDPAGHQVALIGAIGLQMAGYLWFVWPRRSDAA